MPKGIYIHTKPAWNKGKKWSEEVKKKMRNNATHHPAWNKGKKMTFRHGMLGKHHSKEVREIMKLAKLKNPTNYWLGKHRFHMAGKNNWNWKDKNVGYAGLHIWVKTWLGKPQECVYCGKTRDEGKIEWANKSHEYKRDLNDWISF